MRVIVVGAGEVGTSIAESLTETHDVVIVDNDSDRVEELTYELDVLAIKGDGTALSTLEEAGLDDADIVIASTDGDETNVVICNTAASFSDAFTIARVKKTDLLDVWQQSPGAYGADFMVSTDLLTAETIVRVIGLPAALDVDTFAGGTVHVAEFEVPPDGPIVGETVQEADRDDSLTFAALVRDGGVVIPDGETRIEGDDRVVVIGSPESVRGFAEHVTPRSRQGVDDVVIIGGSGIGFQTARLLEERGFHPRLIERDHERARELAEQLPKTTVMESDATDVEFLTREHVGDADFVVSALERDEKNLLVSLLARESGAQRTVAVVDHGSYVDLFETVGVDVAVNPRLVTAEEITRFTRSKRTENIALIEEDLAEVLEVEIGPDSTLVDRPISETIIDLPAGAVIGAITRDGEFVVPRGDTVIRSGDHVIVFAEASASAAVAEAL